MRIFDGWTELSIPKWITISSNTLNVTVPMSKHNGRHGARLSGDEYYSVRTLKCEGTIITEDQAFVEKERSHLNDLLEYKLLRVCRDDSENVFYECMLVGGVTTTYYNGQNISRGFTIGFTLKTLSPFLYGERTMRARDHNIRIRGIVNRGNEKTYPNFFFCGKLLLAGKLLSCGGNEFVLKKNIHLRYDECLLYVSGCLFINRNGTNPNIGEDRSSEPAAKKELVNITSYLTEESVLHPVFLKKGENNVEYKSEAIGLTFYNDLYK